MPRMQEAVTSLNTAFGARSIAEVDPTPFAPDGAGSLSRALVAAGVELEDATMRFVDGWPTALLAAVRAVIFENLTRTGTVPITFAWAPGYDYELSVWDVRDSDETAGGITVLFKSRYPGDPHPLAGGTGGSTSD